MTLDQTMQAAMSQFRAGRRREAADLCRQALALHPDHPDVLNTLGVIEWHLGHHDPAAQALSRAIALKPTTADYHNNLGLVRASQTRHDEAIATYEKALSLKPDHPEIQLNLATSLLAKNRLDEAAVVCRRAIALQPSHAKAHNLLGMILARQNNLDDAIAAYRRAIDLQPEFVDAHYNLGVALKKSERIDEALAEWRQVVALRPNFAEAHTNLGFALKETGQLDQAIDAYHRALAIDPTSALAHWNLSIALLLKGDYPQGWIEHEWQWKLSNPDQPPRNFTQPQWDGTDLAGRRILLHVDQGFGDTIQFVRFVPLVAARGGSVILEAQPELVRLLQSTPGMTQLVRQGDPLPPFDVHCPLACLGLPMQTTLQTIPATTPYLAADPALKQQWADRLRAASRLSTSKSGAPPGQLRVGLVWAGRATPSPLRSIALTELAPIAGVANVTFVSLQTGPHAHQAGSPPPGMRLIDLGDQITDFADTAALIANLDLLISIDTAAAHLAGALGKPVWVLLRFAADWRWLLHSSDSPWYPTMRLFRQTTAGDWSAPVSQIAAALRALAGGAAR